jgi:hypothetical protein
MIKNTAKVSLFLSFMLTTVKDDVSTYGNLEDHYWRKSYSLDGKTPRIAVSLYKLVGVLNLKGVVDWLMEIRRGDYDKKSREHFDTVCPCVSFVC